MIEKLSGNQCGDRWAQRGAGAQGVLLRGCDFLAFQNKDTSHSLGNHLQLILSSKRNNDIEQKKPIV